MKNVKSGGPLQQQLLALALFWAVEASIYLSLKQFHLP